MQKKAGSVLWVAMIIAVPSICGFAFIESSGAAGSIMAVTTLVALASTIVVRSLFKE